MLLILLPELSLFGLNPPQVYQWLGITFNLDKDIEVAFNEIQSKVSQVARRLPKDVVPPVVRKVETNASAIMWLSLTGNRTIQQLNLYASNILKKKIETVDGVGEIRLGGKRDRTVRINLLPEKMSALKITAEDLISAFDNEHVQFPGGFLVRSKSEKMFKLDLEFHNVNDIQEMIIAYRDGGAIKVKDIAEVEDGLDDYRETARFNGETSIGLGIVKVANTNTVDIIKKVREKIENEITPNLPPGLKIQYSTDDSIYIKSMVKSPSGAYFGRDYPGFTHCSLISGFDKIDVNYCSSYTNLPFRSHSYYVFL